MEKRVADVKALDPNTVSSNDQRVTNVEQRIAATILEVFGPNYLEYRNNQYLEIWQGPKVIGMSPSHVQQSFAAGTRSLLANKTLN